MALATAGGASATIVGPITEARDAVLAAGGGRLPRVVIDSTGNAAVFSAALGLAADRGTVVVLGDTGQPGSQTLTPDVIMRGLTIVGAHDGNNTAAWNNQTITALFYTLAATGRFPLDGLNTIASPPTNVRRPTPSPTAIAPAPWASSSTGQPANERNFP